MAIESALEQIKERVSIVDLVSPRVKLSRSGKNLKGLCPFHTEKTPSFYVFPDRDNYHCFGCGQSGDVFTFVMRTENVDFSEALRSLAERAGVELVARASRRAEDTRRTRMVEMNAAAARYFQAMLFGPDGAAAFHYVGERGLTRETIEAFQIGWAPDSWDALLRRLTDQGYSAEELAEIGLVVPRESGGHYDRFRARLMFPIRDASGDVIAFGGRAMGDQQPKYLNSSDSPIFQKGATLYGIDRARAAVKRESLAVVVEGYMDAVVAHQAGIEHVVASLGTSLTEDHLLALKRLAPRVVLALDADAAGDAAALRTLEVLRGTYGRVATPMADRRGLVRLRYDQELDVRVARLPEGRDPDEVILESPQAFLDVVATARPILEVLIDTEVAKAGADVNARSLAADNVLDVLKELPNPVAADQFVRLLAERLGVDYEALRARMSEVRRLAARRRPARPTAGPGAAAAPARLRDWLTFEEFVIRSILLHPESASVALTEISLDDVYRADARAILEAVQAAYAARGAVEAGEVLDELDAPLADHARWVVEWGADVPEPHEMMISHHLETCVLHLRMLNYRREIALIAAHRRDVERDETGEDWSGERARVGELTAAIHALERQLRGRQSTALSRDWIGFFREESRLGMMRSMPPERSRSAGPPEEIAAAG